MPLDLKDLYAGRQRRITIELGEDESGEPLSLAFKWSPEHYTKQTHAALQDARETQDAFLIAEAVIVPLVTWWDLTEGGKPYPITTANVEALGLFIGMQMMLAIEADFEVPANLKGTSGASSSASDGAGSSSPSGTEA
jgi:hypothetical protein